MAEGNLKKFNKAKHRVLYPGRNNPRHQYKLGADLLESSSAKRHLGVLVGNKLTVSQQHALVAGGIMWCVKRNFASRSR